MEPEEYVKMNRLEDTYWWFVGRRNLVRTLLSDRVVSGSLLLDLGCGTGAMSRELQAFGSVVSLDFEHAALDFSRQRGIRQPVQASAEQLPFLPNSFDAITALDVIEHLDGDLSASKEIYRVLKPGGVAIITVPAFPFLWSEHDIALHHRRRYVAASLKSLLQKAGLEVERLSYVMSLPFPAVAGIRAVQHLRGSHKKTLETAKTTLPSTPGTLNAILTKMLDIEAKVVRRMNLPFGVSLVAVARKSPS